MPSFLYCLCPHRHAPKHCGVVSAISPLFLLPLCSGPAHYQCHLSSIVCVPTDKSLNIVVSSPPFDRCSSCPPVFQPRPLSMLPPFCCLCPHSQSPPTLWCSLRHFTDVPLITPPSSFPTHFQPPSLLLSVSPQTKSLNIVCNPATTQ